MTALTRQTLEDAGLDSAVRPRTAAEIARAEKPYFPNIDEKVLADCIATYQKLGCWKPHVEITQAAFEKTLDIYEYNGLIKQRYRYDQVCAQPPSG